MVVFLIYNISNNNPDLHVVIASVWLNNEVIRNKLESAATLLLPVFLCDNHQASNNTSNGNQQISNVNLKYN